MSRLMVSVSGIRGEIGLTLTPEVAARFGAAFGTMLGASKRVVIGRDSRPSGPAIRNAVAAGLMACGVDVTDLGIVTTPGTAHIFSPKALRGAMGSTLRLPCLEHLTIREITKELGKNSILLVAATLQEKTKSKSPSRNQRLSELPMQYTQLNWKMASAVLFGQEGKGISPEWDAHIHQAIFIPMQPPVESLNVAAAATVILYESFRRRAELS
jgi:tRNA G18 (ribose-2'-O)-methylase SpoU